jgi:hypothetical protein
MGLHCLLVAFGSHADSLAIADLVGGIEGSHEGQSKQPTGFVPHGVKDQIHWTFNSPEQTTSRAAEPQAYI